jgi:hypothetical protein
MGVWYDICGRTGNLRILIEEGSTLWRMWPQLETYIAYLFVISYSLRKKNGTGDGWYNNEKRE